MLVLAMWPTWVVGLLIAAFVAICLVLILAILIQRPAGGGLVGAFGSGAGSGQTAFGTKTGDALTIATITMFLFYIVGAILLTHGVRSVAMGPTAATPGIEQAVQVPGMDPVQQTPAAGVGQQPAEQPAADQPAEKPADQPAESPAEAPSEPPPGEAPPQPK